jgi:60 kDa SS-A/Ro ribonucleoprotein
MEIWRSIPRWPAYEASSLGNITKPIPQSEPLDERQVPNNAGGHVYQIDDWKRLDRFLVLGSDSSTYYQKAADLTRENAKCVERCYALDSARTVARIVEISDGGRAPKNDPAIFALALGAASPDVRTRQLALGALPQVCRIGTHLFQFVTAVRALGRGWGRTLKRAVARWYDEKPVDAVAYQAIKYRSREGYSHKRLLQTAHPSGGVVNEGRNFVIPLVSPKRADEMISRVALYRWLCEKEFNENNLPVIVQAHRAAMASTDVKTWVQGVEWHNLPWEALPTEANAKPEVWQAMLPKMGLTALIRNLGNMTRIGAITPLSDHERIAVERIKDRDALKKARVHPFTVLQAKAVYATGRGVKGSGTWSPSAPIIAALEDAFYAAFDNVVPTNKRTLIGLDVSGSMSAPFGGTSMSVAEAAAAMCMVTVRTEPWTMIRGFATDFRDLGITAKDSLETVLAKTTRQNFGNTDCALPMVYAWQHDLKVDVFYVFTDMETWAGSVHPMQALRDYRWKSGINAKLITVAMTSTGFSIADPKDGCALDVVGFDSAAPAVMADFARG